jgi:ubiquinone/menaquinone biosynthesis C-methylase UbiE
MTLITLFLARLSGEVARISDKAQWFAALYDTVMAPLERSRFHAIRKQLLGQARGTVLEIGAGTGVNFPYYTEAAHVIAVEPDPCMVARSFPRATQAAASITVLRARAEALPFPDHTFDTVVGTLVFCTIPDPRQALSELQRISKPAGTALFFEHVRVPRPLVGRLQEWLTPLWKRIAGGCHLNRNTLALITQAGFEVTCLQSHYQELFLVIEAKAALPSRGLHRHGSPRGIPL